MREYSWPPEEGESRAGNENDPGGGLGGLGSILRPRPRARGCRRGPRCRGQGVLGGGRRGQIPWRFLPVRFTERGSKYLVLGGSALPVPAAGCAAPRAPGGGCGGCGEPEPSPGGRCASRPVVVGFLSLLLRLFFDCWFLEISPKFPSLPTERFGEVRGALVLPGGHFQRFP